MILGRLVFLRLADREVQGSRACFLELIDCSAEMSLDFQVGMLL